MTNEPIFRVEFYSPKSKSVFEEFVFAKDSTVARTKAVALLSKQAPLGVNVREDLNHGILRINSSRKRHYVVVRQKGVLIDKKALFYKKEKLRAERNERYIKLINGLYR